MSATAVAMLSPRAAASRAHRATAPRLMSVAVTEKPARAKPMAWVPMPQDASSTAPGFTPRLRSSPVMTPACCEIDASQSAKMRWYSSARSS